MYNKLILYRNELKNKQIYTYKLIGITSELLFSKEIFPKNKDITIFLDEVFCVVYKDYIIKSRTMIVSKIARLINHSNDHTAYSKKLLTFINESIEELKYSENIRQKKNDFDGWIK